MSGAIVNPALVLQGCGSQRQEQGKVYSIFGDLGKDSEKQGNNPVLKSVNE